MRVNTKVSAKGAADRQSGRVQRNASRADPAGHRCRCLDCGQVRIDKEYA